MLSPRENMLAMLNHQSYDFIPNVITDNCGAGGPRETFENGPMGGGVDDFGLKWLVTRSANGQAVPDPTCHPVSDVTEWKTQMKLPDLDSLDWEGMAADAMTRVDRENKVFTYSTWNHVFLRFSHLLGFEDALCAMYEEPEASFDMMSAITDYKCRLVDYVAKYFKPDIICAFDDVCTERGPFMSPATYRELIKPLHKRFNDAVKSYGIIPHLHCCGYCQDLIPDFIDEGAACWEAAQPTNDIVKIIKEYGDRIVVMGGYDTNGMPGRPGVTDEEIEAEVKRMMSTYGPLGSYIAQGFLISDEEDPMAFINNIRRISGFIEKEKYKYSSK